MAQRGLTLDQAYGGGNPFDPETEPAQYAQWNFQHPTGTTLNDSDTPTPWWDIALTGAKGVAPFFLQDAAIPGLNAGGGAGPTSSAVYGEGVGVGTSGVPVFTSTSYAPTVGSLAGVGSIASGATSSAQKGTGGGDTSTDQRAPGGTPVFRSTTTAPTDTAPTDAYNAGLPAAAMVPQGGTNPTPQDLRNTWDTPSGAPSDQKQGDGFSWGDFFRNYGSGLLGEGLKYLFTRQGINNAVDAQVAAGKAAQDTASRTAAGLNRMYANQGQQYRDILTNQLSNMSPYTSLGAGAAGLLGQGLGVPVTMPKATPITPSIGMDYAPGMQIGQLNPTSPAGGSLTAPRPNPFPGSQPFNSGQGGAPLAAYGTGTVTMRAPDGTTKQVSAADAAHYQAQGAVIVGGGNG